MSLARRKSAALPVAAVRTCERRQPGFHHELHLPLLEVPGEASRRAGIGAKAVRHARIRLRFEIPLGGFEKALVFGEMRRRRGRLLVFRTAQRRQNRWRNRAREKRIAGEERGLAVNKHRSLPAQGRRHLPRAVLLHGRDQILIHRPVTHRVGQAVNAVVRELSRILQIKDVRHHPQSVPVPGIDNSFGHGVGHLGKPAQFVVHPQFEDVDALGGLGRHFGLNFRDTADSADSRPPNHRIRPGTQSPGRPCRPAPSRAFPRAASRGPGKSGPGRCRGSARL